MLSSQNQPETQPLNLENTPPLLFLDNSDDDESMWGWLHPSSSFNFQPLGNQILPFIVLPMIYFTSFKSPSFKILVKIRIFYMILVNMFCVTEVFLTFKAEYLPRRGTN